MRLSGCAVTACSKYATPFYSLNVDREVNDELMSSGEFEVMTLEADEDEHSIEMHLPYIARVMQGNRDFTVVPILVGSLSPERETKYGRIFAKYLSDPSNLFVISSDFCHWGQRFRYTYYDDKKGEIHESIKALDHAVIALFKFEQKPFLILHIQNLLVKKNLFIKLQNLFIKILILQLQ